MKRRTFIQTAGLLGAAGLLPALGCAKEDQARFKLGLQLYSINDDMNKDPIGTLKAVKAMGYEDFEIYGFDAEQGTFYGIPAAEFKTVLEDLELTVSSGHYGFADFLNKTDDELKRFVDQCIGGSQALGASYITWPWIAPEQRNMETFKQMPDILNQIGEQVNSADLGFAYHNHGFEFEDHDGENGYDIIIGETDPELVKLQIDMYWVMHSAKQTPKELIDRYPGRFKMWHIKDMDKVTRDYTELGNGSIDYTTIMPDPDQSGLEFFYIEQGGNFSHSALQSAADSLAYFKEHLQQLL
ncbi:MAG: sugar phosphate isomerase/epimerase [Bacteroidota bacterium]